MNETLRVLGRQLCKPCATDEVSQYPKGQITADSIGRLVDPTVCGQMRVRSRRHRIAEDRQSSGLRLLRGILPKSPVSSLAQSFVSGTCGPRCLLLRAELAVHRRVSRNASGEPRGEWGDFEGAAALSDSAAKRVPDFPPLRHLASFYRGFSLLKHDKYADALHCFQAAAREPSFSGTNLTRAIRMTEASIALKELRRVPEKGSRRLPNWHRTTQPPSRVSPPPTRASMP